MSLILTRNNHPDPPESYRNYFRDTIRIPAHSEIAVHTCAKSVLNGVGWTVPR